jgi:uncharacterized protein YdhG (YjbR/CyaY superfamily)
MRIKCSSVDEYLSYYSEEVQQKLESLRSAIKKAAPKAMETISYSIPAYKQKNVLVYFAAYKNHIGFYPTSSGIRQFKDQLAAYKVSKGAAQFPIDQPLPLGLIVKIVKFRVKEDNEKAARKL